MKQKNFISNLKNIFFTFLLKIRGFFVQKPTRKLTWSVEDYEFAKKWSKSQKHPYLKLKTLWDYCEDRYDSVYTIQNVNNFIKI
jgi:hypothetical protein